MKLYFPIADNGMGLSQTRYAMSMFFLGLSPFMHRHTVVSRNISYCYPDGQLNILSNEFLESDCDRMVIIDTDESFEPRHVEMLLSHDDPFVAGMYCKKMPGFHLIIDPIGDEWPFDGKPNEGEPLVEVARVSRGFVNIHRSVFEEMKTRVDSYTDSETGKDQYLFWKGLPGGHSEDFDFCDRYRAIGGKIMVDKRIIVNHHGNAMFPIPGTY